MHDGARRVPWNTTLAMERGCPELTRKQAVIEDIRHD
jgi:hypothetical protein